MNSPLSHQQLAMYMTPEEIKSKGVNRPEMEDEDEGSTEKFWDRKFTESHAWDNHGLEYDTHNLAADVKKRGVQDPVSFNLTSNKLTDGYHRVASARPKSLIPVEYE
jgi:hypothetical protein